MRERYPFSPGEGYTFLQTEIAEDAARNSIVRNTKEAYQEYFNPASPDAARAPDAKILLSVDTINGLSDIEQFLVLPTYNSKVLIPYGRFEDQITDIFIDDLDTARSSNGLELSGRGIIPDLEGYSEAILEQIENELFLYSKEYFLIPQKKGIQRSVKYIQVARNEGQNPFAELLIAQRNKDPFAFLSSHSDDLVKAA